MDFIGLELRELHIHILIIIGLLLVGGVVKIILQQSTLALKLDTFKDHAEKRMDQHDQEIKEHRNEFIELIKEIRSNREQDRREFTELIREVRDNREEMRLALQKK